jgi:hypothetical protein
MFDWYSIGVAIALAAFCGVFVGYGLACFLHDRHPVRETAGAAYDACEEIDDLAIAARRQDDATARRLLNY